MGYRYRARGSVNSCKGAEAEAEKAYYDPGCPLGGATHCWLKWGEWSDCPVSCGGVRVENNAALFPGGGVQFRTRGSSNACAERVLADGPSPTCGAGIQKGKKCDSDEDCPGAPIGHGCNDYWTGRREGRACPSEVLRDHP